MLVTLSHMLITTGTIHVGYIMTHVIYDATIPVQSLRDHRVQLF